MIFLPEREDKLSIAVDAGCLGIKDERLKTGVFYFAVNLLHNLSFWDKKNQYFLYSFYQIEKKILDKFGNNFHNLVLRPKKGWLNLRLSAQMLFKKTDIFLGLNQALPYYHPKKSIVFIHDLAFEYFPACYPNTAKRLSRLTKYASQKANKLVAVSKNTKNDLIKIYNINKEKIEVIYHGLNEKFFPVEEKEIFKIKRKYRIHFPYFLFIGSFKPIKNIPNILESFFWFVKKTKIPFLLVLAGSNYNEDEKIEEKIVQLKLNKNILKLGYVNENDLPALYSGATGFISPSFYEGFSLPIIEAMACGCPVITSKISTMLEITDKAALLVSPYNTVEISQALYLLAFNKKLCLDLKKKGLKNIKKYNWNKSAKSLLNIIKNI